MRPKLAWFGHYAQELGRTTMGVESGRTIFITGAGAGIGAATARLFASRGWKVGASDVNPDALEDLRRAVTGGSIHPSVADVRDAASVGAAIADFAESQAGGRLDAVFANAGVLYMGPDESITAEQKQRLID